MCNTRILFIFLTLTCFIAISDCYFLTTTQHDDNTTLARFRRQSKCRETEHQCGSGDCVNEDALCDGKEDCRDGSDENSCSNFPCPSYLFKCAYGACINSDFECDQKKDCKDNSDETSPKCSVAKNPTSQTQCSSDQFACDSGECIDDFDLCDGKANCRDGSDETVKVCGPIKCQKFAFKCDYGGCINSDLRCNGKSECVDGSDEKNCGGNIIKPPTTSSPDITTRDPSWNVDVSPVTGSPTNPGSCQLPPALENGKWSVFGAPGNYKSGDYIKRETILMFQCNTQYALFPNISLAFCNNSWSATPKCLKTCSSIGTTKFMTATCTLNGSKVSCDTPYQGTRALVSCTPLYEDPQLERNPYRYCDDGSWDYALPQCEPVCGFKSVEGQELVIGGKNATKGEYPWQIGIYRLENKMHICGASMISPVITISAAHCFASTDPKDYLLAAGKYYRTYNDPRDADAQYSNIKELIIHEDYHNGEPYFAYDIAILVLETPFKISKFVLPVCIEFNPQFDLSTLINEKGIVTGWGYTQSDSNPSEVLKVLEVDFKTKATCTLPPDFLTYYIPYAPDKLCAGLLNKGESACQGDSGGGLVFPKANRYYVRGIVSVAPRKKTGGCDATQLTLFTSVKHHVEFIQNVVDKNRKTRLS